MRVRDHVALSTAGAALLFPIVGRRVLGAWAGSILIDADHYLWFCVSERRINPAEAVRFFNQADAPRHQATRLLHSPFVIAAALLLGLRHRRVLPVAVGIALHVAMDVYHEARLDQSRLVALRRDRFTCRSCGRRGADVVAHLVSQPRLLPSYRPEYFVTLCPNCHDAAHEQRSASRAVPA